MDKHTKELQQFAEALLDVDRLKIVGELAKGNNRRSDIAEKTGITEDGLDAHLDTLVETGVVTLMEDDGRTRYQLNEKALEEMSKRQFKWAKNVRGEPDRREIGKRFSKEEKKYIRSFTDPNGVIKHLPSIHVDEKLQAVLKYAMQDLEAGRIYSEKDFNQALSRFTKDPSSVRRYLVDYLYVDRKTDGSAYWLKEGSDD